MTSIDSRDFLDELQYDLKVQDPIKAKIVLSSLSEVDEQTQKKVYFELSKADDEFTIHLLTDLNGENNGLFNSFPMLKEIFFSKVIDNTELIVNMLQNGGRPHEISYLSQVAGEMRLEEAVPALLKILSEQKDENVLEPVINALGVIGDPSATAAVGEFLYCEHTNLIRATIRTLGQFGTPTAVRRLAEKIGIDRELDEIILEIFARLQSPEALAELNKTLSSQFVFVRNTGRKKLVQVGEKAVPYLIKNIHFNDPDLQIHSLNILGDINDETAISEIRKLIHNHPKDPNVRFAAYEALGKLPLHKGAYVLAAGLQDQVDNVRSAAAGAIDRNYDDILSAGIKNMVRVEGVESINIIRTIINSQCDQVFLSLLEEEVFKKYGLPYLVEKAHPDISSHFKTLLLNKGYNDLLEKYFIKAKIERKEKPKVYAIDDSKMILNIFRTILYDLGYNPCLFEFPEKALAQIRRERPAAILTDLNMPDISGIELAKQARKIYNKNELPIIMVTTQKETLDKVAAYTAGINVIIHKPFTEEQISKTLLDVGVRPLD